MPQVPQRRCQVVHLHKPPHNEDEALPLLLLLSGFGQLLVKGGDLTFQLHSLRLILMRQLHKPLIADLSDCIVLIELFIEPGNGIVSGHCLSQLLLTALLLLQQLLVGLSGQQLGKGIFIVAQIFCHPSQLQHHHLLNGVRPHIVPSGAASTVVHLVVGAHKIVNIRVDGVGVVFCFFASATIRYSKKQSDVVCRSAVSVFLQAKPPCVL